VTWIVVLLLVSIVVDFFVRKFYDNYQSNNLIRGINALYQSREEGLLKKFQDRINVSMPLYGIVGTMDFTLDIKKKYEFDGEPIIVGNSSVIEKTHVKADNILNHIANMKKSGADSKRLSYDQSQIRDYFYVKMVNDVSGQVYTYDSQDLFDNVSIGDTVLTSIVDNYIKTIAYIKKDGGQNA